MRDVVRLAEVFLTTFGTFEDCTPPLPFVDIARTAKIPRTSPHSIMKTLLP